MKTKRINLVVSEAEYEALMKIKREHKITVSEMLRRELQFLIHYYNNWCT